MPDQGSQTVLDTLLAIWILHLGARRRIRSDQWANKESEQLQILDAEWRIEKVSFTRSNPRSKGVSEAVTQNFNR